MSGRMHIGGKRILMLAALLLLAAITLLVMYARWVAGHPEMLD